MHEIYSEANSKVQKYSAEIITEIWVKWCRNISPPKIISADLIIRRNISPVRYIILQNSLLTPKCSLLTRGSTLLTPQSSLLTLQSSLLTPESSLLTRHSSLLTPQSSLLTLQCSLLTSQSSLLTRGSSLLTRQSCIFCSY